MKIETHEISIAVGGLCQTLGENALTRILSEEVYSRLNRLVIARTGTMNMEYLLNAETPDSWKVLFMHSPLSHIRHHYIFIRVEGK